MTMSRTTGCSAATRWRESVGSFTASVRGHTTVKTDSATRRSQSRDSKTEIPAHWHRTSTKARPATDCHPSGRGEVARQALGRRGAHADDLRLFPGERMEARLQWVPISGHE